MTTPHRLRRRQRIEGTILVLLGIFTVGYVLYDSHEAKLRDLCMAQSFSDLGQSLTIRSDLTVKADKLRIRAEHLQDQAIQNNTRVVEDVSAAQDSNDVAAAFVRYKRVDEHIDNMSERLDKQVARVTAKRIKTEIPPFPTGTCGQDITKEKHGDRS